MRKLSSFTFITLNGFYKGANEDISWHRHGGEEADYAKEGAQSESVLLFGRKTYEMMACYWPTPLALEQARGVAEGMNRSEKIVFSTTLQKADWQNTRIVASNLVAEVQELKQTPGNDLTILGSGSVITQLTDAGLIDEYQVMIDPVALGEGKVLFHNLQQTLNLKVTFSKVFNSGVVLLHYAVPR